MGILKHVVLPIFAIVHTSLARVCLFDGPSGVTSLFGLDDTTRKRDDTGPNNSPLELRATRSVGAIQCIFAINAVLAVLQETAHYRAVAVLLEAIYWSIESYGFWTSSSGSTKKSGTPAYCLLGLSVLGLGIHSMEPGIFTKDKTK
jgi:hypothetical protein